MAINRKWILYLSFAGWLLSAFFIGFVGAFIEVSIIEWFVNGRTAELPIYWFVVLKAFSLVLWVLLLIKIHEELFSWLFVMVLGNAADRYCRSCDTTAEGPMVKALMVDVERVMNQLYFSCLDFVTGIGAFVYLSVKAFQTFYFELSIFSVALSVVFIIVGMTLLVFLARGVARLSIEGNDAMSRLSNDLRDFLKISLLLGRGPRASSIAFRNDLKARAQLAGVVSLVQLSPRLGLEFLLVFGAGWLYLNAATNQSIGAFVAVAAILIRFQGHFLSIPRFIISVAQCRGSISAVYSLVSK